MNIAIIGTGHVGQALAQGWTRQGHRVIFGSRNPSGENAQAALAATAGKAQVMQEVEAAQSAEVIVLAVPWSAAIALVQGLGDLTGKILIDATNPIAAGWQLAVGKDTSAAEQIAAVTQAAVVKAFNSTGAENMANPIYDGVATTMFICGDDANAKQIVTQLSEELGFAVADVGALTCARFLEPLAMVWINLAFVQGQGRNIAFRLVKR